MTGRDRKCVVAVEGAQHKLFDCGRRNIEMINCAGTAVQINYARAGNVERIVIGRAVVEQRIGTRSTYQREDPAGSQVFVADRLARVNLQRTFIRGRAGSDREHIRVAHGSVVGDA